MDEWVKQAKERRARAENSRKKMETDHGIRTAEIVKAESSWIDRVNARIQQLAQQEMRIRVDRKLNGLVLTGKGNVEILFLGHMNYSIRYLNVFPPTNLMTTRVIIVYHHRLVRVREMNSRNIEEILKYVALGMDTYTELAEHDRIERNLEELLEVQNQYEHVQI